MPLLCASFVFTTTHVRIGFGYLSTVGGRGFSPFAFWKRISPQAKNLTPTASPLHIYSPCICLYAGGYPSTERLACYNHIRKVLTHSTLFLSKPISCRSLIIQGSLFYCAISQCTFLENTKLIARSGQEFHPGEMTVSDELICDTNVSIQVVFKGLP